MLGVQDHQGDCLLSTTLIGRRCHEVAELHVRALGGKLTKLSKEQADYIGVPKSGPYKPDHYRY
jgi:hypothetical protein